VATPFTQNKGPETNRGLPQRREGATDFMKPFPNFFFVCLPISLHFACCGLCFEIGRSKATRTNDSNVVGRFLKSNIFSKFGIPRAIISGQDNYFCNQTGEALM
jgi:hypothetical protein